jgi:hypothetical protein
LSELEDLSELDGAEAVDGAAAAAGVDPLDAAAGDPSLLEPDVSPDPDPDPDSDPAELPDSPLLSPPLAPGFALPYPSAYQPPPLKLIAGAEITRSSEPPQKGQTVISASENFWIFSVWRLHCLHSYS